MTGRLDGRVAVVTGGAAGIGQAYARRLAQDGARVVVADVADASQTVSLIEEEGGEGLGVTCDVSSPDDVAAMAGAAEQRFGQVDILVHNAAIYPFTTFDQITYEEWRRVMSINLDSAFLTCHELLPGMRARGWGRVICISSGTFHLGSPGQSHYVASKGGIIGFIRSLAAEVGEDGVTVNSIAPGLVRSKGTTEGPQREMGLFESVARRQAIKRTLEAADLVGAMSFLVSDEAAFITGQTLAVDGGLVRA